MLFSPFTCRMTLLKSERFIGFWEVGSKFINGSLAKLKVIVCHWFKTTDLIISHWVAQGDTSLPFCNFNEIWLVWVPVIPLEGTYIYNEKTLLVFKL